MIERKQHELKPGENAVQRQHRVPVDIYKFAKKLQIDDTGRPTLPDVYFHLICEGLELVNSGISIPTFSEIGRPDESSAVQIRFGHQLNNLLLDLKKRADSGEFQVVTTRVAFNKNKYTKISLISLAITLMGVAIKHRQQPVVG